MKYLEKQNNFQIQINSYYLVMLLLESDKLRKAWDEEAVHVVLGAGHELTQGPEGILLRI